MAKERETYTDENGVKRYVDTNRKVRHDAGKKPTGGTSASGKKSPPSLALERMEAQIINTAIQGLVAARYQEMPVAPSEAETEHLAKILRELTKVPPFSFIQGFIRKLFPLSGGAKPGASLLGDFVAYVLAWRKRNPDLSERVYISEPRIPDIPFYPKSKVAFDRVNKPTEAQVFNFPQDFPGGTNPEQPTGG